MGIYIYKLSVSISELFREPIGFCWYSSLSQRSYNMTLKKALPDSHQGLTPPDSPTKRLVSPQATAKNLNHLFDVLAKMLPDLTNREPPNTPILQEHPQPGPDMVHLKQLLVKLTDASKEQEGNIEFDLEIPICTTSNDFKSFEKWASKSQFETCLETYELPTSFPICIEKVADGTAVGTERHADIGSASQWRPAVIWTNRLSQEAAHLFTFI